MLVIMATCAAERETSHVAPVVSTRSITVSAPFLGDDAAFAVDAVVAIETGGHLFCSVASGNMSPANRQW